MNEHRRGGDATANGRCGALWTTLTTTYAGRAYAGYAAALILALGAAAGAVAAAELGAVGAAGLLRVECRGDGAPTVVAVRDAGGASSEITRGLAQLRRLCLYERVARRGAPAPVGDKDGAEALHAALNAAGGGGPYLLLAAPAGRTLADAFARRYPGEIAGVVRLPFTGGAQPVRHGDGLSVWPARRPVGDAPASMAVVSATFFASDLP